MDSMRRAPTSAFDPGRCLYSPVAFSALATLFYFSDRAARDAVGPDSATLTSRSSATATRNREWCGCSHLSVPPTSCIIARVHRVLATKWPRVYTCVCVLACVYLRVYTCTCERRESRERESAERESGERERD